MNTVCADANVFLEGLLQRGQIGLDCLEIIELAESRELILFISSSNLMNVIYFLQKSGKDNREIVLTIKNLLSFTTVISPNNTTIINALDANFNDIEDGIQYYTALQIENIAFFITSNIKDFKKANEVLQVLTPQQFLKRYKSQKI
ncbi:MAG: PIN domain-containing protein [Bacteroidota bacterium]|nr:PIN domain-containing protein [Bacteroidota bacterium]